jgi:hypothetical protein
LGDMSVGASEEVVGQERTSDKAEEVEDQE